MSTIAERNAAGVVTMQHGKRKVSAKIPQTRSMIGIIATNGIVNGAEYREDGWVYLNDVPIRKWHIKVDDIRVWEPRLADLAELYRIYKHTQSANNKQWERLRLLLKKIWDSRPSGATKAIAHAIPTHKFEWNRDTEAWWEYHVHNDMSFHGKPTLSFGFDWVENKPKKVVNLTLGKKLHKEERRWYETTLKRHGKARAVFYNAMKKSLPKPTTKKVISLQFGNDTFWFYTADKGPNCVWWEMFDDQYEFEIKKIV